ncbi:MAG TPA: ornithine carbamoyltransferase [Thermoleophilaceae bacterium]
MITTTEPRHLLRARDLSPELLDRLLRLAADMKDDPLGWRGAQAGKVLACFFSKPSTRTRVSLEAAAQRLGMLPVMLRPEELQLGRGEPISDTGRVLSGYVDAITVRTFAQADVDELAAAATVPVINALTDDHHPCQALADLLTIRERFRGLEGIRLAYLGDGNNVAHSLMEAGALAGMEVVVSTPYGYCPRAEIAVATHATLEADPLEAVRGAQVVYTDVWVSMGQDAEREQRLADLAPYQVSTEIMDAACRDAIFMHCLPAHRGEEVTAEVIDGPRSVVFQQAANRLPTEQALIHTLIERWR